MIKLTNKEKGQLGEEIATQYLKGLNYRILERNWHYSKNAELDIVAMDKNTLVFVEVKARSTMMSGHPFEAINVYKLEKLRTAINAYLTKTKQKFSGFRCDGIAVIGFDTPQIQHLKNIYFG